MYDVLDNLTASEPPVKVGPEGEAEKELTEKYWGREVCEEVERG